MPLGESIHNLLERLRNPQAGGAIVITPEMERLNELTAIQAGQVRRTAEIDTSQMRWYTQHEWVTKDQLISKYKAPCSWEDK